MFESIKVGGLEPASMLEQPGLISAVVFLMGCNFRCPFCHNPELLSGSKKVALYPIPELLADIFKKKGWVDSVVFTGGEPTLYRELPDLMKKIKAEGFEIGIHTNGTNPAMLKKLLKENVLSYLAMDIKNSEEKYVRTAGKKKIDFDSIKKSIKEVKNANPEVNTVFRITIVPGLVDTEDIEKIGKLIKGARKISIQQFRSLKCVDKKYEEIKPYEVEALHEMADIMEEYVEEVDREFI